MWRAVLVLLMACDRWSGNGAGGDCDPAAVWQIPLEPVAPRQVRALAAASGDGWKVLSDPAVVAGTQHEVPFIFDVDAMGHVGGTVELPGLPFFGMQLDGSGNYVLATDHVLTRFDADGTMRWQVTEPHPVVLTTSSMVYGVDAAGDVAYLDATNGVTTVHLLSPDGMQRWTATADAGASDLHVLADATVLVANGAEIQRYRDGASLPPVGVPLTGFTFISAGPELGIAGHMQGLPAVSVLQADLSVRWSRSFDIVDDAAMSLVADGSVLATTMPFSAQSLDGVALPANMTSVIHVVDAAVTGAAAHCDYVQPLGATATGYLIAGDSEDHRHSASLYPLP